MLGNLKKKLNSAIQGGLIISESLQQQYLHRVHSTAASSPTRPTTETTNTLGDYTLSSSRASLASDLGLPPDVNMAAGCNLLAKYEDDWKAIHDANEVNAQKAEKIAKQIGAIEERTIAHSIVMTDLISCMSAIPGLVTKLKTSMETLQAVSALSVEVEEQLEHLEDMCEECDLHEFMLHKQFEISKYKQNKMAELEIYRQRVAAKHQESINQHEQRLHQIQRERQAVFDDAFREDLQEFKQKGTISKIHKESIANGNGLVLEEVVLDDGDTKDALEDFLNG